MINFYFEEISDFELDINLITAWIKKVISNYNFLPGEITFIFCSDPYLLDINLQFLNHNYFTDIITFDYCDGTLINGDVFISIDTVLSNSKDFGVSFSDELYRVIIHGILHLIGFDDKTKEENEAMHKLEDSALEILKTIS